MKKRQLVPIAALLMFITSDVFAGSKNFTDFSKDILKIRAKPKMLQVDNTVLIMHPMIKNRKSRSVSTAKLTWKGSRCMIRMVGVRHVSGRKMRMRKNSGRPIRYYYVPKKLKQLLTDARITGWKYDPRIMVKKQPCPGYRFIATINGISKKGSVCLRGGKLYAVQLGFNTKGVSHAANMKESGSIWYFARTASGLVLSRIFTIKLQKSRGIPYITTMESTYSQF